ncbi:MAG TPA: arginyltransferase, partial [Nitrosomonas sp.]|nr:arginyltransferase [Nitrosomonas sp.]
MKLHVTESYPCSYLPDQLARSEIAVPDSRVVDTQAYAKLIQEGFRRSG